MRRDPLAPYLSAGATLLACGALIPVVSARTWPLYALLMVSVITASGIGLRALTRSRFLVVAGQLAIGIVVLTMLFAREHAVLGLLPGPHALDDLGQLARDGMDATKQFSTPAPDVPGLKFLITLGVFGVALAVDALAVTGGTAVGAGLPLLVLYCVPAAVLPHGAGALSFAAVAGGWLVLLAHDGRLRIDSWGRVLRTGPESGRRRYGDDLEVLGTSARRLGMLTVAAAIVVPLLLPSLPNGLIGSSGIGTGTGTGAGGRGTSVDPILTLRQNLTARSAAPVLTYTTDQSNPPVLRLVTDDRFDGDTWRSSDGRPSTLVSASDVLPPPIGLGDGVPAATHEMQVKVGTLAQGYLPVPYPARQIDVDGTWAYAPDTLDIISRGRSTKGLSYKVTYLDVQPTAEQLQQAPQAPVELVARYTQLPDALSPDVGFLARELTRSAQTQYDKAVVLQQWFRVTGGFTYDTNVDTSQDADAVSTFLTSKHGYCVQFASAMAVMARTLGIPARLGVGFLPGTKQANGRQGVSLNDAHAWPELYFEGIGWVRFEPTPQTRTGAAPSYTTPVVNPTSSATSTASTSATPRPTFSRPREDLTQNQAGAAGASAGAGGRGSVLPVKVWVLLGLLVLALAATPGAALLTRWRRRRGARDADARAEAAWAELLEQVDDLGIVLPVGATPRQIQDLLLSRTSLGPDAAQALGRLVAAIERVRYAPPGGSRKAAPGTPEPSADVAEVVRTVRASRDRASRLRARVLPRSGTDRLVGLSARAGERIAGVDRRIARGGRAVTRGPAEPNHPRRTRKIFGRRSP